jgi:hypothetical protein
MALKNNWTTGETVTASDLNNTANEILGINAAGVYASLPTAGHPGCIYDATDNGNTYRDNGTSWDLISVAHTGLAGTEPPSASWSTTTLGSATFAADKGGRLLNCVSAAGDNWRLEYRTLSPTSNYTATFYIEQALTLTAVTGATIVLRNSTSGSFIQWGYLYNAVVGTSPYFSAAKWTNPTTFSANYKTQAIQTSFGTPNWLRFKDDGTNRLLQLSYNGIDYFTFHSVGRTDFITPDQIGWGGLNSSSDTALVRLRSWSVV